MLQSLWNVPEHRLERKTIHFEKYSSPQKKLKNQPNPTQVKYHLPSVPPKTKIYKIGLLLLQSI